MKKFSHKLVLIIFLVFMFSSVSEARSDIEIIKERVLVQSNRSIIDDSKIEFLISSLSEDGTWPGINYEDVSNEGFEHTRHLGNMLSLAQSYQLEKSIYYKSKRSKDAIERALKHWILNDYTCENWWHNQIGTPNSLVQLMLVIGNDLDTGLVNQTQLIIGRANIDAPGARPGGDRIKIAGIEAKNMLFLGDSSKFDLLIRVIEGEIKFSDWIGSEYGYGYKRYNGGFSNRSAGGRGIQYDYSFHHRVDGVNNTISYGLSYAYAFIEWAEYVHGTAYAFSQEKVEDLIDYYLDGICKSCVYGKYPDPGAKNRSFSRRGALRPYNAGMVKCLTDISDYREEELREIADIRENKIQPTTSHATFYWHSEHFTFQRPDFFTSVRMYSSRNYNMEQAYNSEGLLNHHRADGTNHLSIIGDEYYDIAPVFDYQKIPGATIMQKPGLPPSDEIQKLGLTDFVGAATDGKYAAVAFDFKSPHDPLCVRKAWFFFDEEYVCLGSGISCTRNLPVVTTLNQCLLRDDVTVSQNNNISSIEEGEHLLENVDWVFQDGIGYFFPIATNVNIKNSSQIGSWWLINKQSSTRKGEVKEDIFKIWIDHGNRPSDESYEYIVVPATSVEEMEKNSLKSKIQILSNSNDIQAVKNNSLNIFQVVFYKAGEIELAENLKLFSGNPGIVLLKTENNEVTEITVADPNRELAKMYISIPGKISELVIDLPQGVYAGKSVTIEL